MKIAIVGYGKMGRAIEKKALESGHEVVLKIGSENQGEMTSGRLQAADVAIEFSRPETAFENISTCLKAGLPVVSGTTAWLNRLEEAKAICEAEKGAFFYASNFSIGVNIFFALNQQLAKMMSAHPAYGVEMEEIHHTQKVDYPSGTAITLAEGILGENTKWEKWKTMLHPAVTGPAEGEFPIVSKREDHVPGTHYIRWSSGIDTIEIGHTAHSREGFVNGAIQAAQWLIGKQGFFGMEDLLG